MISRINDSVSSNLHSSPMFWFGWLGPGMRPQVLAQSQHLRPGSLQAKVSRWFVSCGVAGGWTLLDWPNGTGTTLTPNERCWFLISIFWKLQSKSSLSFCTSDCQVPGDNYGELLVAGLKLASTIPSILQLPRYTNPDVPGWAWSTAAQRDKQLNNC